MTSEETSTGAPATGEETIEVAPAALEDLVRHAGRTVALVGFPGSGKSSYLVALGKDLGNPQASGRWKVVRSHRDVATYAAQLIRDEMRPDWQRTHPQLPPRRLRMFWARRVRSPLFCRLTTFDTSGEHYLAIGEGREPFDPGENAYIYADAIAQHILPRCPGIVALIDCSLDPEKLSRRVLYYSILFNKLHRFEPEDEEGKKASKAFKLVRRRGQRVPVAFAVTKVDRLEGREIRLPRQSSAYWQYLQARGLDPAKAGVHGGQSGPVSYTIRAEVFLDRRRHPDPAEGQAIIQDFVRCHMEPLAGLVETMETSGVYEVAIFPVSNWGKELPRDAYGTEQRPDLSDIRPAGVMEPQFWVLERIFQARRQRVRTSLAKYTMLAVAALLLIGPGLFWGLYAGTKKAIENQQWQWAYWCLRINNAHPYTRFIAPRWEPAAVEQLVKLNSHVIEALSAQRRSIQASELVEQVRKLGANTRAIDRAEWLRLRDDFNARVGKLSASPGSINALARTGRQWIRAGARLGPEWFYGPVYFLAKALRERGYNPAAWRQFAKTVQECNGQWEKLDGQDHSEGTKKLEAERTKAYADREAHRFRARYYLEEARRNWQDPDDPTSETEVMAALARHKKAEEETLLSGDAKLIRQCHDVLVERLRNVIQAGWTNIEKDARVNPENTKSSYDKPLKWWDGTLALARQYPTLAHDIWKDTQGRIDKLQSAAEKAAGSIESTILKLRLAYKLAENMGDDAEVVESALWLVAKYLQQANQDGRGVPPEARMFWMAYIERRGKLPPVELERMAGLIRSTWDQLRRGYLADRFDERDLRKFGISPWQTALWKFDDRMQKGDHKEAILALANGAKDPSAKPEEALPRLEKVLKTARGILQKIPQRQKDSEVKSDRDMLRNDILTPAERIAATLRDKADADLRAAFEAAAHEAQQLLRHLKLTENMVLVRPPAGSQCKPFYIDRHEVTAGEYLAWLDELRKAGKTTEAEAHTPKCFSRAAKSGSEQGRLDPTDKEAFALYLANYGPQENPAEWPVVQRCPVVGVSHIDATAYAQAHGKRLPTPDEWQALRKLLDDSLKGYVLKGEDCNVGNVQRGIVPVDPPLKDTYKGIVGIAGNVREWCAAQPGATSAYTFGESWNGDFAKWRQPKEYPIDNRDMDLGFRCALGLVPPKVSLPTPAVPATLPTQPTTAASP